MMNFFNFGFPVNMRFEAQLKCYSVGMKGKEQLESSGKIILPPSALDQLARLRIDYPMLFEITGNAGRVTHCGVLEFVADEGLCYMPYWMMQNLLISEGSFITIKSATLQKGNYVKIQPMSDDFTQISNPRAVLEHELRNWSALTEGDILAIHYGSKTFELQVLEVKPKDATKAISVVETDIIVDFAPTPGEMERMKQAEEKRQQQQMAPPKPEPKQPEKTAKQIEEEQKAAELAARFPGSGNRLNSKPVPASSTTTTTTTTTRPATTATSATKPPTTTTTTPTTTTATPKPTGGMVFGKPTTTPQQPQQQQQQHGTTQSRSGTHSTSAKTQTITPKQAAQQQQQQQQQPQEPPKPAFVPFSGKGYSLK